MENLVYSTRTINRSFKIKVTGEYEGKKLNTLVGVKGLLDFINDIPLANRILNRAFSSKGQKCVCKLRRGIAISFYNY